jgi:hypothetical protein
VDNTNVSFFGDYLTVDKKVSRREFIVVDANYLSDLSNYLASLPPTPTTSTTSDIPFPSKITWRGKEACGIRHFHLAIITPIQGLR